MFALALCASVLKTETALRCEHVCMYVSTSICISKSVCNLYIIDSGEEMVIKKPLNWLHGKYSIVRLISFCFKKYV